MKIERIQTPPVYPLRESVRREGIYGVIDERAIELDPEQGKQRGQFYGGNQFPRRQPAPEVPESERTTPTPAIENGHVDIVV